MEGEVDKKAEFFGLLLAFIFLNLFWSSFKADMTKRDNIKSSLVSAPIPTVQVTQQPQIVYRRVYVNNNYGGPATVYYVRQQ